MSDLNDKEIDLYRQMFLIRYFEEEICPFIEDGTIMTPCHLYIGQEAIAVGVSSCLDDDDLIWGNHRSHGHYLAKGGNLDKLAAEIFCKETGCSGGRGGSMHILDTNVGILGTVPIVAGTVPLAVGAALKFKISRENSVSVSYLGDGATEEGHVIESMNMASLYELPVLFVIENNLYSSHMHMEERRKQEDLLKIGESLGIESHKIDGNNLVEVMSMSSNLVSSIRKNNKPIILECMTYRWRGHVGYRWDEDVGVKRKDELDTWLKKDPLIMFKKNLLTQGISEEVITSIEEETRALVTRSISKALEAPFPKIETLQDNVFSD